MEHEGNGLHAQCGVIYVFMLLLLVTARRIFFSVSFSCLTRSNSRRSRAISLSSGLGLRSKGASCFSISMLISNYKLLI